MSGTTFQLFDFNDLIITDIPQQGKSNKGSKVPADSRSLATLLDKAIESNNSD